MKINNYFLIHYNFTTTYKYNTEESINNLFSILPVDESYAISLTVSHSSKSSLQNIHYSTLYAIDILKLYVIIFFIHPHICLKIPDDKVDLLTKIWIRFDKDEWIRNPKGGKQEQHVLPQRPWKEEMIWLTKSIGGDHFNSISFVNVVCCRIVQVQVNFRYHQ